jgi:UDPglucose 6-dehydrogenase
MRIAVVGTGYVGLVTGACLAECGNHVVCLDVDAAKVGLLRTGVVPIYEPGLEEIIRDTTADGRLKFTTAVEDAVPAADIVFLCVGTPTGADGRTDLRYLDSAVRSVGRHLDGYTVVVCKSTVPVGTNRRVAEMLGHLTKAEFDVVSNPEFLKEGTAVRDFGEPDRVVVGARRRRAFDLMHRLYEPLLAQGRPLLEMDPESAELVKYAANALLATKISFINEIAGLCEAFGADVRRVREGLGSDPRIGPQFLAAGIGFGGSCFPKDLRALIETAADHGRAARIAEAALTANEAQKQVLPDKIEAHFGGDLAGRTIAVWGLAFKPGTDDIREASSLTLITRLLTAGAKVRAADPKAIDHVARVFGDRVGFFRNPYEALDGADALALVTEWADYREPDWDDVRARLAGRVVFDGRNLYDPVQLTEMGFIYYGIGVGARVPAPTVVKPAARVVSVEFTERRPAGTNGNRQ